MHWPLPLGNQTHLQLFSASPASLSSCVIPRPLNTAAFIDYIRFLSDPLEGDKSGHPDLRLGEPN